MTTAPPEREVNRRLRSALAGTLDVDIAPVTDDADLTDAVGPRYDSLAALEVVTAVEKEFGIEVDFVADDIRHSFSTLGRMTRFVADRLEDTAALGSPS